MAEDSPKKLAAAWLAAAGPYEAPVVAPPDELSLGDLGRQAVSSMRGLRHRLANTALALREGHERRARDFVGGIAKDDEELKGKAEAAAASSPGEARERWWYLACQDAHCPHDPATDPPASPERVPGYRGCLEVHFLAVEEEPPLVREDGKKALDPVCQCSLEGRNSGALHAAGSRVVSVGQQQHTACSSVRFVFHEVSGVDLRVNLFDHGCTRFKMGFEHEGFCGGAFVPLALVMQRGSSAGLVRALGERLFSKTFETRIGMALLPLDLLRTKNKLEPGQLSGALRPLREHGHILLHLKLTLYAPPLLMHFMSPVLATSRASSPGQVGDPLSVLKAAAGAAARAGQAANVEPWLVAANELRHDLVPAALLHLWWTFAALWAPFYTWPLVLVSVLPFFAWKVGAIVARSSKAEPLRMYTDEVAAEPPQEPVTTGKPKEYVQKAVKEAVNVQLSVMQLVETVSKFVSHAERTVYVLALGDNFASALCGMVAFVAAGLFALPILGLQLFLESGYFKYVVWLTGCCLLLPDRLRGPLLALRHASWLAGSTFSRYLSECLSPLWLRVPDGPEAAHLALFERYVLINGA